MLSALLRTWPRLALLACALATATSAAADQTDGRLDQLFDVLASSQNAQEVAQAEATIWSIWFESGDEEIDRLLGSGSAAMSAGRLDEAIGWFDRVVNLAPEFAEGFNRRATAYYLAGRDAESVVDIQRTLALEPRHFGAISGMGLIFLRRGDERGALSAYEAVLAIHPRSLSARVQVERLRRKLEGKRV